MSFQTSVGHTQKSYSRICLPSSQEYDEHGLAMVAGYGRYRRAPCEVGRQGPEKFEYCGTGKECARGAKVRFSTLKNVRDKFIYVFYVCKIRWNKFGSSLF